MKDFPLNYLQRKLTDSVANQNGNREDLSPHLSRGLGGGVPIYIVLSGSDFPQK
jgi:hypothetical protein